MDKTQSYRIEEEQGDSSKHGQVKEGLLKRLGNWLGNTEIGTGVKIGVLTGAFWGAGIVADYVFKDYHGSEAMAERAKPKICVDPLDQVAKGLRNRGKDSAADTWINDIKNPNMAKYYREKQEEEEREIGSEHPEYAHVIWTGSRWKPESGYTWVTKKKGDLRVKKIKENRKPDETETNWEEIPWVRGHVIGEGGIMSHIVVPCNSYEDRDKNGRFDYPKDFTGIKEKFGTDEQICLFVGFPERLKLSYTLLNHENNSIQDHFFPEETIFGISKILKPGELNPGRYTALFKVNDKGIVGEITFEVTKRDSK